MSSNRRRRSRLDRWSSSSSIRNRATSASSAPSREAASRESPCETAKIRLTNMSISTPRTNGVDAKRRRVRSARDDWSGNARDRLAWGGSGLDRSSRDSLVARCCSTADLRNASLVSRSRARSSFSLWVVAVSASTTTERSSVPPYVDGDAGPGSSARACAAPPPMHHARNPRGGDPPPSPCPPASSEDGGAGGSRRADGTGGARRDRPRVVRKWDPSRKGGWHPKRRARAGPRRPPRDPRLEKRSARARSRRRGETKPNAPSDTARRSR